VLDYYDGDGHPCAACGGTGEQRCEMNLWGLWPESCRYCDGEGWVAS
jgi:DnaJ-class molecular chaperone